MRSWSCGAILDLCWAELCRNLTSKNTTGYKQNEEWISEKFQTSPFIVAKKWLSLFSMPGLSHLVGSSLLRAYMHGFFMDIRLYHKVLCCLPYHFFILCLIYLGLWDSDWSTGKTCCKHVVNVKEEHIDLTVVWFGCRSKPWPIPLRTRSIAKIRSARRSRTPGLRGCRWRWEAPDFHRHEFD